MIFSNIIEEEKIYKYHKCGFRKEEKFTAKITQ